MQQFFALSPSHCRICDYVGNESFRIMQDTFGEILVSPQELLYIFFENEFGMNFGPVVGTADEQQEQDQVLQADCVQKSPERLETGRSFGGL
jgi:hypothetical protein